MACRSIISLCAAACCLVAACETVVDVAPPSYKPQLVVHGFFTSDSLWLVRVTGSVPYTSRAEPGSIDDAVVMVAGPDDQTQTLVRRDSGLYMGTGLRPEPQADYTVRVNAHGYASTEGSDRLPEKPQVSDFTASARTDEGARRVVELSFAIDDPAAVRNYYGVFVVQGRWRLDVDRGAVTTLAPTLFTFESSDPIFRTDPALDFLGDEVRYFRDPLFDDTSFDGTRREVDLRIRYQDPRPGADTQIWRAFAIVVVSTSADLYEYWTTANRQLTTGQNPFAEPIRVHSNMSNGPGIFGAFQYRVLPISPLHTGLGVVCDTTTQWRVLCGSITAPAGRSASLPVRTRFLDSRLTR